jgi:hypothetical protein
VRTALATAALALRSCPSPTTTSADEEALRRGYMGVHDAYVYARQMRHLDASASATNAREFASNIQQSTGRTK